ncbi:MAG: FapA family protein [Spirochaetales bacterium]|jgi:uncharacterized protein (DUF342 family)|nr:FapA family protein [Spirochaetales bacterium]
MKECKGALDITINPSHLEADFIFHPSPQGPEWTPQALRDLLEKKRIKHGWTEASLASAFNQLSDPQAQETQPEILVPAARGTPATPPVPESFDWQELPVPPEWEAAGRAFLKAAPPPAFFEVRIEKLPPKAPEKKGLFGGREKPAPPQTREVKIPLPANPETLAWGWAEAGALLGGILPGQPGKEGTDIFGRPLMAPRPGANFIIGQGVVRKKDSLIAGEGGILRRGDNWVEILPFRLHRWSLALSGDQNTALLNFTPGEKVLPLPGAPEILAEAQALLGGEDSSPEGSSADSLIGPLELADILQQVLDSRKDLTNFPLSTDEDSEFEITLSEDRLTAVLYMKKGRGRGKPLGLKEFGRALKEKNFKNVNLKKIQDEILAFYRSRQRELTGYVLAQGVPPSPPGERTIVYTARYLEPEVADRLRARAAALLKEGGPEGPGFAGLEGLKDYPPDRADRLAFVRPGTVIAEITRPPGRPGEDVFGRVISLPPEADSGIRLLTGTARQENRITALTGGLLEQWDREKGPVFRVRTHQDASAEIKVAANRMTGSISLSPALGTGFPLTREEINGLIKEKNIVTGIEEEILSRALERVAGGETVEDLVFAHGELPRNAGEASLKFLVNLSEGKGVTIKTDGRADYRNQDRISLVEKGQTIARLPSSSLQYQDGRDITGQTIPAKAPAQQKVEPGDNVEVRETEGEILYVALTGGEVIFQNNRLSVLNVHTVQGNVGKDSGNIRFAGAVRVGGLVQSGYFVMAGESIQVKDTVEAALLSSGGAITVGQGIVGGGRAVLRARDSITAGFAEQATLLAVGDIVLKKSCMLCTVKTNGRLVVQGDKGVVFGGTIRARGGVEAHTLGSAKQVKTWVYFGQDYLIQDQIELEQREIDKLTPQIAALSLSIEKAEREKNAGALERCRGEKLKLMKALEKRNIRALMLRDKFEEHHLSAVNVRGTLYPGVALESHGRVFEITKEYSKVSFVFDPETGKIVHQELKEKK